MERIRQADGALEESAEVESRIPETPGVWEGAAPDPVPAPVEPEPTTEPEVAEPEVDWPPAASLDEPREEALASMAWAEPVAEPAQPEVEQEPNAEAAADDPAANTVLELRPGGRYRLEMTKGGATHVVVGQYREIRPPEKLVYTWKWEVSDMAGSFEDTIVTLEFHDRGQETELVLIHEKLPTVEEREKHENGWKGCLDNLVALLEA